MNKHDHDKIMDLWVNGMSSREIADIIGSSITASLVSSIVSSHRQDGDLRALRWDDPRRRAGVRIAELGSTPVNPVGTRERRKLDANSVGNDLPFPCDRPINVGYLDRLLEKLIEVHGEPREDLFAGA
jgi:hypothetical protein